MRLHGLSLALFVVLGSWAAASSAATASAFLVVNITLNKPVAVAASSSNEAVGSRPSADWSPACLSEAKSEQTSALVRVVCGTEQFVNIMPVPGKVFIGTHDGEVRYYFDSGFAGDSAAHISAGNVTVLRIYNASGTNGPLEMLVSF